MPVFTHYCPVKRHIARTRYERYETQTDQEVHLHFLIAWMQFRLWRALNATS